MTSKNFPFIPGCMLGVLIAICGLATAFAANPKEQVLYRFQGGADGYQPASTVIVDKNGTLYGTTELGGTGSCRDTFLNQVVGCGTVFQLTPPATSGNAWTHTVLFSFPDGISLGGVAGAGPGQLVLGSTGNLYGTTAFGGNGNCIDGGCGSVFQLTPPSVAGGEWTETVLYSFSGGSDGVSPRGLIIDAKGNLYGVTIGGGQAGNGLIFQLSPPAVEGGSWTKTSLYSFKQHAGTGHGDGADPIGIALDGKGNLYGTTSWGGICQGEIGCFGSAFKLTPPSVSGGDWSERQLYAFPNGGNAVVSGIVLDQTGALYGTSYQTAFQLAPAHGAWTPTVLQQFNNDATGLAPYGGVILDQAGNLYGTTAGGGQKGNGLVFKLTPPAISGGTWSETVLHNFTNVSDGISPNGLILSKGALYGTTLRGGNNLCVHFSSVGCGTVFRVIP